MNGRPLSVSDWLDMVTDGNQQKDSQKTVVDLAIKEVRLEKEKPAADFIEAVNSNLKVLLFAGHETTAQAM